MRDTVPAASARQHLLRGRAAARPAAVQCAAVQFLLPDQLCRPGDPPRPLYTANFVPATKAPPKSGFHSWHYEALLVHCVAHTQ